MSREPRDPGSLILVTVAMTFGLIMGLLIALVCGPEAALIGDVMACHKEWELHSQETSHADSKLYSDDLPASVNSDQLCCQHDYQAEAGGSVPSGLRRWHDAT